MIFKSGFKILFLTYFSCYLTGYSVVLDHYKFLGNYAPTPPLSQHFVLSEK